MQQLRCINWLMCHPFMCQNMKKKHAGGQDIYHVMATTLLHMNWRDRIGLLFCTSYENEGIVFNSLLCPLLTTRTCRLHFSLCCSSPTLIQKVTVRPLGTEVIMLVNDCVLVILSNYLSHREKNNIRDTGSAWQHTHTTSHGGARFCASIWRRALFNLSPAD